MDQVGDPAAYLVHTPVERGALRLQRGDALLRGLALVDEPLAGLALELALHGGGVVVALPALVLEPPELGVTLVVEPVDEIGIRLHEAIGDISHDRREIVLDKFIVEHGGPILPERKLSRKRSRLVWLVFNEATTQ